MSSKPDIASVPRPRMRVADTLGCGVALLLAGLIAVAVVRWRHGQVPPDLRPALWGLAALAGLCLAGVLLVLWGPLSRRLGIGGRLDDPRVLRQGRVQAVGDALVAPLSRRPCVAWSWRATGPDSDGETVVVCGGLAAMAFDLVGPQQVTAVRVLPHLLDPPRRLRGPVVVDRLRHALAGAAVAPGGTWGGLQQAAGLVSDMADQSLAPGALYQRCWHDGRSLDGAAGWDIEETVLEVDVQASVLACAPGGGQTQVPSGRLHLPALAAASDGGLQALHQQGPAAADGSMQQVLTAVVVLGLFGGGALALTGLLR